MLDWFLKQQGEINGYTHAFWTGVTTLQLAKSIVDIMQKNICGLLHLVNNQKISKYDLLMLFKKYFDRDIQIRPYSNYVSDKSLVSTRKDVMLDVPGYDMMVRELSEWMKASRLYSDLGLGD